jgi:hypothetical protein
VRLRPPMRATPQRRPGDSTRLPPPRARDEGRGCSRGRGSEKGSFAPAAEAKAARIKADASCEAALLEGIRTRSRDRADSGGGVGGGEDQPPSRRTVTPPCRRRCVFPRKRASAPATRSSKRRRSRPTRRPCATRRCRRRCGPRRRGPSAPATWKSSSPA